MQQALPKALTPACPRASAARTARTKATGMARKSGGGQPVLPSRATIPAAAANRMATMARSRTVRGRDAARGAAAPATGRPDQDRRQRAQEERDAARHDAPEQRQRDRRRGSERRSAQSRGRAGRGRATAPFPARRRASWAADGDRHPERPASHATAARIASATARPMTPGRSIRRSTAAPRRSPGGARSSDQLQQRVGAQGRRDRLRRSSPARRATSTP